MLRKNKNDQSSPLSETMLGEQREVLYRYALLHLRDSTAAEDTVQETLLAAWQSASAFAGKAKLTTWLIGILKHKIADHWRRHAQEAEVNESVFSGDEDDFDEDDFFMSDGHWQSGPSVWQEPEAALRQLEFWEVYEACQNNLPPKMAQVFMLRELVGLEADEVCRETGLSDANYWVIMHRARLRLRECLEIRWFNQTKSNKEGRHA